MMQSLSSFFKPAEVSSYEQNQREKTLTIALWCAFIAGSSMGFLNLYLGAWQAALTLFALSVLCLPAYWLNFRGRYALAATLISFMAFFAAFFNLYDGGGLHDPGVVSYPILIIMGSLFFGRRAVPFFALASIGSLATIAFLEINGHIRPEVMFTDIDDFITISILLVTGSVLVWVTIHNTQENLRRIKQSEAELRKAYDLTLEGWAKALEYRDRETEGHSRRVVDLATKLARVLECSEEEITQIRRGALLHDIGKLAIPDTILFKPKILNSSEEEIIRQHPIYAREMIMQIPFLQPAMSIPFSHHERWDGKGYPQGLKGEEIPLPARIFSVIDQWEALTSDRPYRKAWSKKKACTYLRENAGKCFDPQVVEAFLGLIE